MICYLHGSSFFFAMICSLCVSCSLFPMTSCFFASGWGISHRLFIRVLHFAFQYFVNFERCEAKNDFSCANMYRSAYMPFEWIAEMNEWMGKIIHKMHLNSCVCVSFIQFFLLLVRLLLIFLFVFFSFSFYFHFNSARSEFISSHSEYVLKWFWCCFNHFVQPSTLSTTHIQRKEPKSEK